MGDYLLGIDYGTGGAKAALIDSQGAVLGFGFEEYPFIHEHPGWSEHDPVLYWDIACRIIGKCVSEAGVNPREIRGIAASSALPSMVMVDRDANPINRAYNLMDRRALDEVQWLKDAIGADRLYDLSGYRLEDHPNIVNLLWEKNHRPESYKKIWKALTIDGFITLKLTGKAVVHNSGAAFYGVAFDLRNGRFDEGIMQEIGLDIEKLPEIHQSEEIVGEVTSEAAEQTGLAAGIPVAAGQVDCNASWIGAGAVEPGDIQSNLGSVGNFGVVHKDVNFIFSDIGRVLMNFPYTIDSRNTYVIVPTTITGGQTLRYLRDTISQAEVAAGNEIDVSAYDLLTLKADKVPAGSDGLITLPFLMGERTPIWDAYARGVIFGLSLNHTKGHMVRSMMEGVAYAMYDSFRLVQQAGLKINFPMILNEGGAVSRTWRQIITDVFNVPTAMVKRRTGAPFGDAILAGVAAGVFKDFSISKEWAEYVEPLEPDPEKHEKYQQYFRLYKKIYEHVKEDFKELAELRGNE
jgi:xylulokinase